MVNYPVAEIIAIGSELVSGYIVDTNSSHVARTLSSIGIELRFISAVGDDESQITDAVSLGLSRSDVVLTTGGMGPTVDDKTRDAVAIATGNSLVFQTELLRQIKSRFSQWGRSMSDNNLQQAYMPEGALAIENPVGTAPCFIVNQNNSYVICLPGVPRELIYLLEHEVIPYLRGVFPSPNVIKARVLHTAGLGESVVDSNISDLETLESPTVGLAAHSGVVDIRITATASDEPQANQLISGVEDIVRERLGNAVFGADGESLELVVLNRLEDLGYTISVAVQGSGGVLADKLAVADAGRGVFRIAVVHNSIGSTGAPGELDPHLSRMVKECLKAYKTDLCLASMVITGELGIQVGVALLTAKSQQMTIDTRGYGGPVDSAAEWSANLALNLIRTRYS